MQIHMKSDRGEIEVFLCPEEDALGVCSNIEDSETDNQSPIKIKREGQINYNAPQLHAYISSSLSSQTKMESNSAGGSNGGPSSYSNTLEVTSAASSSWDAPSRNSASGDVEENQVKIVGKFLLGIIYNKKFYSIFFPGKSTFKCVDLGVGRFRPNRNSISASNRRSRSSQW